MGEHQSDHLRRGAVGSAGTPLVAERLSKPYLPPGTRMPVYPVAAGFATSCASPGCWCRDRRPCYPSDLTDAQWRVLEPRAREVMRELTIAVGRPMVHDLRAMCDAVAYVVRNGIEWRALPADFPPWQAVYAFYERWNSRGLPQAVAARLRESLRARQGRAAQPSACIVDSQMVKCADTVAQAHQRLPRRQEDHRREPAPRRRCGGLAARARGHRRVRQRQGRAQAPGHPPARRRGHA